MKWCVRFCKQVFAFANNHKWWTRFTVARPILLPTHQPTAHGAHAESLGATHPAARTPSSWDATGNYFQLPLPAVAQGSSNMEFRILGATLCQCRNRSSHQPHMKYGLTSLRLLQQIQMSKNDVLHGCQGILQSSTNQLYSIWANK